MQLNHYNSKFEQRIFSIILVCDNVTNASNIGSLFRTCDAFGIQKLVLCGDDIGLGRKMKKTSRATEKIVDFEIQPNALNFIEKLKIQGYLILSLEITQSSIAIHNFKLPKGNTIAIVVGDENFGISESILNLSDTIIHIDMFGKNSSMNVVQATNIALYEITKQLRAF